MTPLMRTTILMLAIPLLSQLTALTGAAAYSASGPEVTRRLQAPIESSNGAGFGSTEQLGLSGSTPGYIVEQDTHPGQIRPLSTPVGNGGRVLVPHQRGLSGSTPGYIMNQRALQNDSVRPLSAIPGERTSRGNFDWDWLGLLGLLGLAGSRKRASTD
ncbi:WGxxGxxG-CTERM domain-containing protein [Paenibacillus aurantiacus]|uniref:WGxxGxxG-CTERM domain-containing protein n=1 Tax=Paenibacillus aurantiacus TaxID=1936118 RepID=A0ABV5KWR3_9BACL